MRDIAEQLTDIYYRHENWHKKKLPYEESINYFSTMIEKGNLVYEERNNVLVGYCEFLRVTFEQWGRIVCYAPFNVIEEDTINGNVCVVNNLFIHPVFRHTNVIECLKRKLFIENDHCEYFTGVSLTKKNQPIKVFKRENLVRFLERMSTIQEVI